MKTLLRGVLVLGATAAVAMGQTRVPRDAKAGPPSYTPDPLTLMNERIEEVALLDVPLDQALEWIADFTALNIVVRWRVLEDLGIERERPVTIQIHNLRFSQVLWLILYEAGGPDVRLAYRVDPGLVTVSSETDLERDMLVMVYDVSDLLLQAPRFTDAVELDIAQAGGSGGQSIFNPRGGGGRDSERGGSRTRYDDVDRLIELITEVVEPDSWAPNGGQGTIDAWGNLVVVRNSAHVHQALGGYIEKSR